MLFTISLIFLLPEGTIDIHGDLRTFEIPQISVHLVGQGRDFAVNYYLSSMGLVDLVSLFPGGRVEGIVVTNRRHYRVSLHFDSENIGNVLLFVRHDSFHDSLRCLVNCLNRWNVIAQLFFRRLQVFAFFDNDIECLTVVTRISNHVLHRLLAAREHAFGLLDRDSQRRGLERFLTTNLGLLCSA